MSEFLALASALAYGVGDFLGGMAGRRRHVLRVLLIAHPVGLALVLVVAVLLGGDPTGADLWWGAGAGLAGLLGLGFFYWSLAAGTMGVVAPVTAAVGAAIPVVVGFLRGERPGAVAVGGVAVAVAAIVLVSAGESTGWLERPAAARRSLAGAVIAGIGFGFFFVLISQVEAGAGMWPLVAARGASSLVVLALVGLTRPTPQPAGLSLSVWAGVLDTVANVFVLAAFDGGLLVVVSVLAALYPVVTILLARFVLLERLRRVQLLGVVLALGAVVLITVG